MTNAAEPSIGDDRAPTTGDANPGDTDDQGSTPTPHGPTRRGLFGMVGAGLAGLAVGGTGGATVAGALTGSGGATRTNNIVPFHGAHQAGITTPAQDRLHFASFTLMRGTSRDDLIELLRAWTDAAEILTVGKALGTGVEPENPLLPPDDTGEAEGLQAGHLTLTFGLGRGLFVGEDGESDPLGLRSRLPEAFQPLPSFAFDLLEPANSGGDLCVQACADDPQVAVHAIRNLARIAVGTAHLSWSQLGFGRTASTSRTQDTPRNLFGFKDGTMNIMSEETEALGEHVWVDGGGPAWMQGGTYLVARKILMTIETWDRTSLDEQERIFGRTKQEGGPLTGGGEFTDPDFAVKEDGQPVIDIAAHVRLAHPANNDGVRILRRGYNYVDGSNDLGQLGAGLFFISFQRDPEMFTRVQQSLKPDLLNEYIRHIGSGLWAVPRGVAQGEYIAQALFE